MSHLDVVRTQGKFTKTDFLTMYDNVDMQTFEGWISEIKTEINWRKGKQVFPPRVMLRIIEHIGQPISLKVLNQ